MEDVNGHRYDADVIVIGGGPAGSALSTFLARDGRKVILLERDIHPRDHVGESLTPSTNLVFDKLGLLPKLNDAGFIHKPGTGWNGPRSPLWKFIEIWLWEFPIPGTPQQYTYSLERDVLDTIMIRHAHENGAKVLQGVNVQQVLFEGDRAVGVRASVADGWERDLYAKVIVDASGRRCLLANQLKMKKKDSSFNQFCIYSWFEGVTPPPEHLEGFTLFFFIGLNQSWTWSIPLRDGRTSIGIVMDKEDFQKSGKSHEEFFFDAVKRNRVSDRGLDGRRDDEPVAVERHDRAPLRNDPREHGPKATRVSRARRSRASRARASRDRLSCPVERCRARRATPPPLRLARRSDPHHRSRAGGGGAPGSQRRMQATPRAA